MHGHCLQEAAQIASPVITAMLTKQPAQGAHHTPAAYAATEARSWGWWRGRGWRGWRQRTAPTAEPAKCAAYLIACLTKRASGLSEGIVHGATSLTECALQRFHRHVHDTGRHCHWWTGAGHTAHVAHSHDHIF